jgi:hypothetical protein
VSRVISTSTDDKTVKDLRATVHDRSAAELLNLLAEMRTLESHPQVLLPKPEWAFRGPFVRTTCPTAGCGAVISMEVPKDSSVSSPEVYKSRFCVRCFCSYPAILFPECLLSGEYKVWRGEANKHKTNFICIYDLMKNRDFFDISWEEIMTALSGWDHSYKRFLGHDKHDPRYAYLKQNIGFLGMGHMETEYTCAKMQSDLGMDHLGILAKQQHNKDFFVKKPSSSATNSCHEGLVLLFMQCIRQRDQKTFTYLTSDLPSLEFRQSCRLNAQNSEEEFKDWCNHSWPHYFLKQGGLSLVVDSDESAGNNSLFNIINERMQKLFSLAKISGRVCKDIQSRYAHQVLKIPELCSNLRLEMAHQAVDTLLTYGVRDVFASRHPDREDMHMSHIMHVSVLDVICRSARPDLLTKILESKSIFPDPEIWPAGVISRALYSTIDQPPLADPSGSYTTRLAISNMSAKTSSVRHLLNMRVLGSWLSLNFSIKSSSGEVHVQPIFHEAVSFPEGVELVIDLKFESNPADCEVRLKSTVKRFSCEKHSFEPEKLLSFVPKSKGHLDIKVKFQARFEGCGARVPRSRDERLNAMTQVIQALVPWDPHCVRRDDFDREKRLLWEIAMDIGLGDIVCDMLFPDDVSSLQKLLSRWLSVCHKSACRKRMCEDTIVIMHACMFMYMYTCMMYVYMYVYKEKPEETHS